jgi:hypothetical protein
MSGVRRPALGCRDARLRGVIEMAAKKTAKKASAKTAKKK